MEWILISIDIPYAHKNDKTINHLIYIKIEYRRYSDQIGISDCQYIEAPSTKSTMRAIS